MGGESLFTECRPKCALGGSHIDTSSFVAGHFRAMLIGIAAITRSCKRDCGRQAACVRPTIGEVLLPEELGACKKSVWPHVRLLLQPAILNRCKGGASS